MTTTPKLLAAAHIADAADYTSKATFGKYLPQVNLNSEYRKDFSYSPGENPNSWSIGIKLTMPLVDLSTVAEISESKSRAQAAYYSSVDTRRQIELQNQYSLERACFKQQADKYCKKQSARPSKGRSLAIGPV